jgi:hypothetical protein
MDPPPPWAELLEHLHCLLAVFDHLLNRHRDLELAIGRHISLRLEWVLWREYSGQKQLLVPRRNITLETEPRPTRDIWMALDGNKLMVSTQRPRARSRDERRLELGKPDSFERLEQVIIELLLPKRRRRAK